jgi:hypothetical protein
VQHVLDRRVRERERIAEADVSRAARKRDPGRVGDVHQVDGQLLDQRPVGIQMPKIDLVDAL